MSHYPQKQPPRFVPTLTQAVEPVLEPGPGPVGQQRGPEPLAAPPIEAAVAAVDTPVAQPTAGPPKKLLQEQLEERINALVASHLRQLEVEIRAEIKNTLQAQRHRFFERSDPE